jgi:beta-lactamase regulating signal transducer with metallopeptidase domain/tetratricopeptide (TPR) repeat protein
MTIEAVTGSRPWLTAGWTMLHFLWVGGALGLAAAAGRLALRRAEPEVRYGFAVLGLASMAAAPAAIAWCLIETAGTRPVAATPIGVEVAPLPRPSGMLPGPGPSGVPPGPSTIPRAAPDRPRGRSALEAAAAGLPWLWIAGTPSTFALLALGLVGADRLRRGSRLLPDGELAAMVRRLADAIGIVRPVALGVCDRLAAPILLGVVRPLILLPPAALAGWSTEQLEMALLHELAHVRRFDNLVNLAQRLIESLLFFHPAVWWISGWVRLEREHCCDRMVVARTGRARPYAELLAELALHGGRPGRAALAMAESPIVARIRCILNPEDYLMPMSRPIVAVAVAMLVAPAVLIAASQAGAPRPDAGDARKKVEAPRDPDRARVEELIRRTRHAAEMFLGVQERVYAMIQIAGVQARTGDREAARGTFRQAEQLAETVSFDDNTYSPHILMWVIWAEERHGFRDEAIAAARKMLRFAETPCRKELRKTDLYINLIRTQVNLGDKDGVQATLRAGRKFFTAATEPGSKDLAPIQLVGLQAASGDLAGALRMTRDPGLFKEPRPANSSNFRHNALFSILQQIKAGEEVVARPVLEEALRIATEERNVVRKNGELQEIALVQARLGLFEDALKSARMIDSETISGEPARVRSDFLDEQRFKKAQTLAEVSLEQSKAGDRAGGRRTAEEAARIGRAIENDRWKYPILQTAEALAMAGDVAGALRLADTLNPDWRLMAYDAIAASRRDAGDAAGARTTTQAAADLVRKRLEGVKTGSFEPDSPAGKQGHSLLEKLGRYQAMLGDRKAAIETIVRINGGTRKAEALKQLAIDLASAGDIDGALEAVAGMNAPKSEAEALRMVASAFSRRETPGNP